MPTTITDLCDPRFRAYFTRFIDSAWRLKTLQRYTEPYEQAAFEWYVLDPSPMESWITDIITPACTTDRTIGRVHVIERTTDPDGKLALGNYLDYELSMYKSARAAGEDIRLAMTEPGTWPKGVGNKDFWLFDDRTIKPVLIEMHHNQKGDFEAAVVYKSGAMIERAIRRKRAALAASKPFHP